uniref:C-type lectin domain-containing protein n=1 Tax=Capra hircus TaxID=9925 RepID=A0A8C2SIL4_CAPHI
MELWGPCVLLCLFSLLTQVAAEAPATKVKKAANAKKDAVSPKMLEELKTQLDSLAQEVALLKEQQALQTVCLKGTKVHMKCFLAFVQAKTFHEASEDCISRGGTLGTPQTGSERLGGHDRRPHRLQELGDGDHRAARRRQGRELRHPVRRGQRQVVRQALPGQAALRLPVRHRLAGREGRAGRGILSPGGGVRGPPRPPRAGRLLSQIKWVHRDGEWLQSVPVPMGGESPGALLGSLGEGS